MHQPGNDHFPRPLPPSGRRVIGGVILAGGGSTRLGGGDKGLLLLGDRPILAHVIAQLRPGVDALALSANGPPERFAAFGLPVLSDGPFGAVGPLAGLLSGLEWGAGQGFEAIVTAAADTPAFPADLVPVLRAAAATRGRPVAIAGSPGPDGPRAHPTFGFWSVTLLAPLRGALAAGERRIGRFAEAMGQATAVFDEADAFFNINTPADLARARARFGGEGG